MTKREKLGRNSTPLQVHPIQARRMLEQQSSKAEKAGTPSTEFERYHIDLMTGTDTVGTIPIPAGVTNLVETGIKKLKGENQEVLLDKLGERLAFERTGVRLYDAVITKHKAEEGLDQIVPLAELEEIRNEELQHFRMLQQTIEELGADPTGVTPAADLTGVMGSGLLQVCADHRVGFASSLEAILVAELTDYDSWESLIDLAQELGQNQLTEAFTQAFNDEKEHLAKVRRWVKELTMEKAGVPA